MARPRRNREAENELASGTQSALAEKKLTAYRLFINGCTPQQIAAQLEVTPRMVHDYIESIASASAIDFEGSYLRSIQSERLMLAMRGIRERVVKGDPQAIDRWLKLIGELNKIYGLYHSPDMLIKRLQEIGYDVYNPNNVDAHISRLIEKGYHIIPPVDVNAETLNSEEDSDAFLIE